MLKRDVGSTFCCNGKTYRVNKLPEGETSCCTRCAFRAVRDCSWLQHYVTGECCGETRGDNINVYYTLEQ